MLDIKWLRAHLDQVASNLARRGYALDKQTFLTLESERQSIQKLADELAQQRNAAAKEVGQRKSLGEDVSDLLATMNSVSQQAKQQAAALKDIQARLFEWQLTLPNWVDDSVPDGSGESDNIELDRWGEPATFNHDVLQHMALGEQSKGMDFTAAADMSGSRFVVLKNDLAALSRALVQWMLHVHVQEHGYQEINVPFLVKPEALLGAGQLPKFADELYFVADQSHALIPTAEVPLVNMHVNQILKPEDLPKKYVSYSHCFRREAGSYGKDTQGMIRMHQFEKVELFQIVMPADVVDVHEAMRGHAERLLRDLELPYRVMALCAGDMGWHAAKTYDLEVWLPSQHTYREISSLSHTGDYQSRRVQTRVKTADGMVYPYMLNGSGLAIGRTLLALMENFQTASGKVVIPDVLRPFMGGKTFIGG